MKWAFAALCGEEPSCSNPRCREAQPHREGVDREPANPDVSRLHPCGQCRPCSECNRIKGISYCARETWTGLAHCQGQLGTTEWIRCGGALGEKYEVLRGKTWRYGAEGDTNSFILKIVKFAKKFAESVDSLSFPFSVKFLFSLSNSLYSLSCSLVIDTKQTPNFSLRFYFGNARQHNWISIRNSATSDKLPPIASTLFLSVESIRSLRFFQTGNAILTYAENLGHPHLGELRACRSSCNVVSSAIKPAARVSTFLRRAEPILFIFWLRVFTVNSSFSS